jgi:hypothetical protein
LSTAADLFSRSVQGVVTGVASQLTRIAIEGGKLNWAAVAADGLGAVAGGVLGRLSSTARPDTQAANPNRDIDWIAGAEKQLDPARAVLLAANGNSREDLDEVISPRGPNAANPSFGVQYPDDFELKGPQANGYRTSATRNADGVWELEPVSVTAQFDADDLAFQISTNGAGERVSRLSNGSNDRALPEVVNLYRPIQGHFANSYRTAVAGFLAPGATWTDRAVYGLGALAVAPFAALDMAGESLFEVPNRAGRAGQWFARGNLASNRDEKMLSYLSATMEGSFAFVDALGPFTGIGAPKTLPPSAVEQFAGAEELARVRQTYNAANRGASFSPIVPGGGLAAHEAAGGHLLLKHVGQSETKLLQRLADEPKISGSSSFYDRAAAESAVSHVIDGSQTKITNWLTGSSNRLRLDSPLPNLAGISVSRGAAGAVDASSARVILVRDPSMPTGYKILTGFPTTP